MAVEIYRSRRTISGQSSSVRADYDFRTGGQAIGKAISGAGSVLMSLGEKWDLQEADTQFTQAKAQAREEHNRFLISLQELEPDDYAKAYSESVKRRQVFGPKNKRAARVYSNWLTDLKPFWTKDKNDYMKAKLNDNGRAAGFMLRQEAIETGKTDEYFIHLAKGTKLGYYAKEEAAKLKQNTIDAHRRYIETEEARIKREKAEQLKLIQEETARQMLADLWDGKLKDPQKITDTVRNGFLTDTNGKYLREALLNPEPAKLRLKSLAEVKQAIEEIGTNTKTKQEALSLLYSKLADIDPATGKSLVNEIFSAQDKNKSEIKRESRTLMEELIRDRDKFTGLFTDDERQILASAEAYLMLDTAIEEAAKTGKPLERREIMIKAIGIGRQMKKKIKSEETLGGEPTFKPDKYVPVNTMIRPKSLEEFNANIDRLPNEDAKKRYFQKWYRLVPK